MEQEVLTALHQLHPSLPLHPEDIQLKRLQSGSNQVFKVESGRFAPVIYRKFNPIVMMDWTQERRNFMKVAEAGLGPKCLGTGAGYRLEEWIESRPLQRLEIAENMENIARTLAGFHALDSGYGLGNLRRQLETWVHLGTTQVNTYLPSLDFPTQQRLSSLLTSLHTEFPRFCSLFTPTDLVFSHNDMTCFNFLQRPAGDLTLIDYEYSALDPPSCDFASLANEVTVHYFPSPAKSFEYRPDQALSRSNLTTLIETYSQLTGKNEDLLWTQFYQMKPARQFFCFLWAICRYKPGEEAWFDLITFAEFRLERFVREMEELP